MRAEGLQGSYRRIAWKGISQRCDAGGSWGDESTRVTSTCGKGAPPLPVVRAKEPSFISPDWPTQRPAIAVFDELLRFLNRFTTLHFGGARIVRCKPGWSSHGHSRRAEPKYPVLLLIRQ